MNMIMTTLLLSFIVILLVITGGGCELCTGKGNCRNKRKPADGEAT
jgi:hypothetical protein